MLIKPIISYKFTAITLLYTEKQCIQ